MENSKDNQTKKYLIYARYSLSGFSVYSVETDDIFHVIGKMHYYSSELIKYFTFTEDEPRRREFWKEENIEIRECPRKWVK